MAKSAKHENWRVEVYPKRLGDFGYFTISDSRASNDPGKEYKQRCEEIKDQIKRHVDGIGSCSIECDVNFVCEFCGWQWTEDSDTYNGGCCGKDEENAPPITEDTK